MQVLSLKTIKRLSHPGLLLYLHERGISIKQARAHTKELVVKNCERRETYITLGIKNQDEGYHVISPHVMGYVNNSDISFIRGTSGRICVNIFADIVDALASLACNKDGSFDSDAIILNGHPAAKAIPYVYDYGYEIMYTWLSNTRAGIAERKTFRLLAQKERMSYLAMNDLYRPFRSVSDWRYQMRRMGYDC